ncbi:MAG: AAA family ATPase [Thermodesulfobacteriota bacterium]|nr:AAA family ATPase [Thermodesulfobacteriota bacterium]
MNFTESITNAQKLPCGARFFRCALQVNPFNYIVRHSKEIAFSNESDYNASIVEACQRTGIEVIAITDHQRCSTGRSLAEAARAEGIIVFIGAEVESKEGLHILLLFEPNVSWEYCNGILGDCGIHDQANPPSAIKYDVHELLRESVGWKCVCIAAHVASEKGLLRVLDNQARVAVWKSEHLLACSVPGPAKDAPQNLRPILQNKNPDYLRDRPVAIINAQDVSSPDDLEKPGSSCWIKMSGVTLEGLRQAFLDPVSRIRLASDPAPVEHTEFIAISWQGGFLDGAAIHLNENLNVLIGGRGTGKSTVVESIRYVLGLEPLGEEALKAHGGIVRQVLRSGTKISMLVRSYHPDKRNYLIERTIPNPPVVKDETGNVLNLTPADVIPQTEVYGQHEISELTKSREKLTHLLDRFVERDTDISKRKSGVRRQLERSRSRLLETHGELLQIEERLATLPAIEETLRRFQDAGLEEKLKEQSLLVREERVLKTSEERIAPFKELLDQLEEALPIDRAFISPKALESLPGKEILGDTNDILGQLTKDMNSIVVEIKNAIGNAETGLGEIRGRWGERKKAVMAAYDAILRELQKSKIDGEEFIRLRRQIEELRPLKERQTTLRRNLREHETERRNLLSEWEDVKAEEFRHLERAAKKVSRKLEGRVLVDVAAGGNREPLIQLLRDQIGGRLSEAIESLMQITDFSLTIFARACREGREALSRQFDIPSSQSERIAQAKPDVIMQIEELELPPTTAIKLNVAADDQPLMWQTLEDLSTGQKATAVLLLLLLESNAPLVVDQPEDDLDNRFISDGIVPKMREEKRRRQFIFATHNANIPVLGDAELIVGLTAFGEAEQGKAKLSQKYMGSIDTRPVRELVEEVLEGGKDAFEMRRLKYGF